MRPAIDEAHYPERTAVQKGDIYSASRTRHTPSSEVVIVGFNPSFPSPTKRHPDKRVVDKGLIYEWRTRADGRPWREHERPTRGFIPEDEIGEWTFVRSAPATGQ